LTQEITASTPARKGAQLLVHPFAAAHLQDVQAALSGEADVLDSKALGSLQIVFGDESIVERRFGQIAAVILFLPLELSRRQRGVGGVARP
jgi:hypothetical protein